MEKIFTCLLLFVTAFSAHSQNYIPMFTDATCWGRKYVDNISLPPVEQDREYYHIFSNYTEEIEGVEYIPFFDEYHPLDPVEPIGYIRENVETQQIFYLNADQNQPWLSCGGEEILLYDFSAEVGDTVYHCPNSNLYYVVQNVETVEAYSIPEMGDWNYSNGRVYEVFSSEFNFTTIYEGVGSNIGPLHEPPNVSEPGTTILQSYERGCAFILNTNEERRTKLEIFPNPVRDMLNIKVEEELNLSEVKIFDASGQFRMLALASENKSFYVESLPNGLYFLIAYDKKGRQVSNQKFVKHY